MQERRESVWVCGCVFAPAEAVEPRQKEGIEAGLFLSLPLEDKGQLEIDRQTDRQTDRERDWGGGGSSWQHHPSEE